MRTWKKAIKEEGMGGICLGPKRRGLKMNRLAFSNNFLLLAEGKEEARKLFENLHKIAEKTGLNISYGKTKYIEYKHDSQLIWLQILVKCEEDR